MNNSNPLDTLEELAGQRRDNAGRALADAVATRDHLQTQLDTLRTYCREYETRLDTLMATGTDMRTVQTYQRFIRSLDEAIARAASDLERQESVVAECRELWLSEHRSVSSFTMLKDRRNAEIQRQYAHNETNVQDDIVNSMFSANRAGLSSP